MLKGLPYLIFWWKGSGCERDNWPLRDLNTHRQYAFDHKNCFTASAQAEIEKEQGIRYSELLELSYFDPIRMCIIDPMHNLLLGTAKHMLSVWRGKDIIKISTWRNTTTHGQFYHTCWYRPPTNKDYIWFLWVYSTTVEKLDHTVFNVFFERDITSSWLFMLAAVC